MVKRWDLALFNMRRGGYFDDNSYLSDYHTILLLDDKFEIVASVGANFGVKRSWFEIEKWFWRFDLSETVADTINKLGNKAEKVTIVVSYHKWDKVLTVYKPKQGYANIKEWSEAEYLHQKETVSAAIASV